MQWLFAPGPVRAQTDSGLYLSQEIGVNLTLDLATANQAANARGSICDQHVNPFTDLMPVVCDDPNAPITAWTNSISGAAGILTGGAVATASPNDSGWNSNTSIGRRCTTRHYCPIELQNRAA